MNHPVIQLKRDTKENWNNVQGFIPLKGEVIIYEDYETKTVIDRLTGEPIEINVPNIKIGTGNSYVQDLAFVDENTRRMLLDHIHDQDVHTTLEEKLFWNNKINVDDAYESVHDELIDETLILNRN